MKYSSETVKQVWNDDTGERIEVSPDRDSPGLVEIRQLDSFGKIEARITFQAEAVQHLIAALKEFESRSNPNPDSGRKAGGESH